MHQARVHRLEHSGRPPALRIADHDGTPARPMWQLLTCALIIAMALWATGILELPTSDRRLVDCIGALIVLTMFVVWIRVNAGSLAASNHEPGRDDRLSVRVIRPRPPLRSAVPTSSRRAGRVPLS